MNTCTFLLLLLTASLSLKGQIKNPGFESPRDSIKTLPEHWTINKKAGFVTYLDESEKLSGKFSLKIENAEQDNNKEVFMFMQSVQVNVKERNRIVIKGHIKTDKLDGSSNIWCMVRDKENKNLDYRICEEPEDFSKTGWRTYSLTLHLNPNAAKILIAINFQGVGSAWYDDFSIEQLDTDATPPTKVVMKHSKEFNDLVKRHSLYADSLNWIKIDSDLAVLSVGLKTVSDAKILNDYVLQSLKRIGDNHSFIGTKASGAKRSKENTKALNTSSRLIHNDIGYISVPGFSTSNSLLSKDFANNLQNIIRNLDQNNTIKGWVIDLRNNTGGNMYPMIAGLGPLFKNKKTLGYFVKSNGLASNKNRWFYDNGNSGTGSSSDVKVKNHYKLKNKNVKIAIIIGKETASSGEMTAVSFIGDKNAKFFGQPTSGYLTGNIDFKLSDDSHLYLASFYSTDRDKKKHDKVYPDITIISKENENLELDEAVNWIAQ